VSVDRGTIEQVVAPVVEDMGYTLVRLSIGPGAGRRAPVLQVMAERCDGTMSIDDCARLSRALSEVLEAADPVRGAYMLEVSSPGIDRPLVRLADYDRFRGKLARVETAQPVEGRRRFRGRLLGTEDGGVKMELDGETFTIAFDDIVKAKLVLTDDLVADAKGRSKA